MGGDASRLGTSKNFGLKERTLRKLKYTVKEEADAVTIALLPRNACHLGALSPLNYMCPGRSHFSLKKQPESWTLNNKPKAILEFPKIIKGKTKLTLATTVLLRGE